MGIAHVQHGAVESGGGATIAVTLTGVTSGNLICGMVMWASTTITLSGVSDGTAYTLLDNPTTGAIERTALFWRNTVSAGSVTVTATFSADPGTSRIIVHEVSGQNTGASAVDQHKIAVQVNPGTGTDAITTGNVTTTIDGGYIGGFSFDDGSATTFTAGTNYTIRHTATNYASESRIQASQGAIAVTFTSNQAFSETYTGIITVKPLANFWILGSH